MSTIRRGDRGSEVRELKNNLERIGLAMTSSSIFDLVTEAGVRTFQEKQKLTKDGIVGANTWKALGLTGYLFDQATNPLSWIKMTPYYSQRNNEYHPGGTCNVTSLAMVLAYHGVRATRAEQLEDELYLRLQETDAIAEFHRSYPALVKMGYSPRHIHGMLGWLAKDYGFKWRFSDYTTWKAMDEFGSTVGPMITSGSFTRSGHIMVITGMTMLGDLVMHDPYGNWDRGYRNDSNGKFKIYNREQMEAVMSGNSTTKKRIHRITPA